MKVKQLIALLKKMPQDLEVYFADHDHGHFEVSSRANEVYFIDKKEVKDIHSEGFGDNGHLTSAEIGRFNMTPEKYVVIRA